MKHLTEAKLQSAFFKYGVYGGNGSGKSYTSSLLAIGLHKYTKAKKPVAFADSEAGSDFVLPLFKKNKVDLVVAKTRSFSDLLNIVDEAEKECSILIIDSVTHFWDDLVEGYKKKNRLIRLSHPSHWMVIKPIWRQFSEKFVASNLHILVCGRAGDVWEEVEDSEGVKELKRTGSRMRVEKELGYEPSLLIEIEKARLSARPGAGWTHRAWVVKDRFDVIDSQHFDNPTFESFLPHIELLGIGGEHKAFNEKGSSQELFNNNKSGAAMFKKRDILVEEIKGAIKSLYPNRNAEDEQERLELMKKIFGTRSWKKIESMQNEDLENGLKSLEKEKPKKKEEKKK